MGAAGRSASVARPKRHRRRRAVGRIARKPSPIARDGFDPVAGARLVGISWVRPTRADESGGGEDGASAVESTTTVIERDMIERARSDATSRPLAAAPSKMGRPRQFDETEALEAAMQVFWRKGFARTTKRDLIEATGVASQSLYNVFGSKRKFFERAIDHYRDTRIAMVRDILEAPGSPLENLRNFARLLGNLPEEFRKGCFVCNVAIEFGTRDDDPMSAMLAEKMRLSRNYLEATFERARRQGEVRPDTDPHELAAFFVSLANGVAILSRSQVPQELLECAMNEALRWLDSLAVR